LFKKDTVYNLIFKSDECMTVGHILLLFMLNF